MEFSFAWGASHNVLQITDSRRGLTIGLELKTCVVESCSAWAKSLGAHEAELGAFLSWEQLLRRLLSLDAKLREEVTACIAQNWEHTDLLQQHSQFLGLITYRWGKFSNHEIT